MRNVIMTKVVDATFFDNPGISWLLKTFVIVILCQLIVGEIKKAGQNWKNGTSLKAILNDIFIGIVLPFLIILIVFSVKLSDMLGVLTRVWWFVYDIAIVHILRLLGFPV